MTSTGARIAGASFDWEMVIGLEVHAQIASASKLFSNASTQFGEDANENVDFVDAAMPGMLPVLNAFCVEQAVRTGLGLNAQINLRSAFDRKNYFYPDLPQGYQISQLYHPIVGAGTVVIDVGSDQTRTVRIERIHLEQDAGKSLHDIDPDSSFVDLNRTGVALMEIVSRPDMRSPQEAASFVLKLRQIMRYLRTCDGNMQNGNLRADVNLSVRPANSDELRTRCEIKNMNSTRFMQQAIEFEANRQVGIYDDGGAVAQETRLFDAASGRTRSMRSKEEAHDYRYFPCPDLLPLELEQDWVDGIRRDLPELPDARKERLIHDYGLSPYDAEVLTAESEHADFFETVATGRDGKQAANWIINEVFGRLNQSASERLDACPVSANQLGTIIDLIAEGTISNSIAKSLLDIVWEDGGDPRDIVTTRGLAQVTDDAAIEALVDQVMAEHPDQVERAKTHPKVAGFLVGQVMKLSSGKANPKSVNRMIREKLSLP